jgi:protein gp37
MSDIQWTDITANPIKVKAGGNYCEKVSPGCANCYASGLNSKGARFGGNGKPFGGIRPEVRPEISLNVDMLQKWGRARKPRKIFVGSMTDVFGEWVPDWMIYSLFDAMTIAPLQTFQILTKRPERALDITESWLHSVGRLYLPDNLWLGVSAEDQKRYDQRAPILAQISAMVRFLSLEPLLGPIEISGPDNPELYKAIDWVIVGGESGPNARPLNIEWIRSILAQCKCYNIPAFVKQLGTCWAKENGAKHSKGGDPNEWSPEFRVRMFPSVEDRVKEAR